VGRALFRTCSDRQEAAELDRLIAAEDAATCSQLRAAGWPREVPCLVCDRAFESSGPANKLCPRCADRNARGVPLPENEVGYLDVRVDDDRPKRRPGPPPGLRGAV